MRIRILLFFVLVPATVGVFGLGLAGPLAASARADDPQRAKELFQEGTRYFDLGQFGKAIDAWQSGYREKADPGFLYNIAQAYRLAGDPSKAIFFYKGYLRNSPKAHNRADVEQKIQALQKQVGEPGQATRPPASSATEPAAAASGRATVPLPPAATAPPAVAPAPVAASASPSSDPARSAVATAPAPTVSASSATDPGVGDTAGAPAVIAGATVVPTVLDVTRPIDLSVGIGLDGWSSGVQGKADASLALTISGGYMLGDDPTATVRFRLGGAFGYTFLKEATNKDTFLSLLIVPTVLIRAGSRIAVFGEVGVGIVGIAGVKPNSVLLDPTLMLKINGTQSLLEVRPAVGLQIQMTETLGLFGALAVDYSPKGTHFYQPISRTEVLVGLSARF